MEGFCISFAGCSSSFDNMVCLTPSNPLVSVVVSSLIGASGGLDSAFGCRIDVVDRIDDSLLLAIVLLRSDPAVGVSLSSSSICGVDSDLDDKVVSIQWVLLDPLLEE